MFEGIVGPAIGALLPILALVLVGLIAVTLLTGGKAHRTRARSDVMPYVRRGRLFTEAEARFLHVLRKALPEFEVFGKVRLEDVVMVKGASSTSEWQSARNKINSRHLDFVLCDPMSTKVLCAVELDDRSHTGSKAQANDASKNRILDVAGLPLVRFQVRAVYDPSDVANRVREASGAGATGSARPTPFATARSPSPIAGVSTERDRQGESRNALGSIPGRSSEAPEPTGE